jgi:CMP/dCMP kinase
VNETAGRTRPQASHRGAGDCDDDGTSRPGLVIAVDGPSGSGKSTAARGAAVALGLRYLDTGAMYRAITWWMLEHDIDLADTDSVVKHGVGLSIEVSTNPAEASVLVDGVDVTAQIRSRRVSNAVSLVAAIPQIRQFMRTMQRQIISQAQTEAGGIVAEGRDIGTVVAPEATVKVFLTASEQVRAERRAAELADRDAADPADGPSADDGASVDDGASAAGEAGSLAADLTRREQARRDRLDAPQTQRAADAVEIDATDLAQADVIAQIVELVRSRARP